MICSAWFWNGNEFAPCGSVPLTDRGFRYGMSVFESLPVRGNTPLFLMPHYERLRHACAQTGFLTALPRFEDFDALLRGISFNAFARIYVTAGDGDASAHEATGRVFVFAESRAARESYAEESYKLALHPTPCVPLLEGLKTANYWANLLALQKARRHGCDESLLFNTGGDLISACMANVFVIANGKIKTPATDYGARAGVIREWVMRKRPVSQGNITGSDLHDADEIFLTSSWLGVMPVASLEGRDLPSREAASQLRVEYVREKSAKFAPVDKPFDLAGQIARCQPVAAKLDLIRGGGPAVAFEHVTEPAQPLLAALIARHVEKRIWVLCENVRAQEIFHGELLNWLPGALFFPEAEIPAIENMMPDPEAAAERMEILQRLAAKYDRQVIVVTRGSLDETLPSPAGLQKISVKLARGKKLDRGKLLAQLEGAGYEPAPQVSMRGQYAVRGGIVDIYSWHHTLPVRLEFFDDVIESIRQFDLDTQTSVQRLDQCALLLGEAGEKTCGLAGYFHKDDLVIAVDTDVEQAHVKILAGSEEGKEEDYSAAFFDHGLGEFEAGDFVIQESKRERFFNQLREWRGEGWTVLIYCNNEGEIERLRDLIPPAELDHILLPIGVVSRGFTFPAAKIAVFSDSELFGRYRNTRARRLSLQRAREQANRAQIDFSEMNEGDLVVHLEHGIGRYLGLQKFQTGENAEEVLAIEFANAARLYVPLEQSYLVSRYVGVGKKSPALSSLGDGKWSKARLSAERSIFDYAAKLLAVHAERETSAGFAFAPDNKWQQEFERSFLYKETPDQLTAITATKADMESERPMDRLICGDVGFGKTEVAIRAAFKAVMNGKQVAVLAPTTVLAQQHYQTFRERMSDYPVNVAVLSRFRSQAEQRKTVKGLREGGVDIVIGTHRLISKDVQFKNLGLVVIDEEQRFGVLHKEKFKQQFKLVDLLTLSATPIPRTLYLSLMGAKDMSTLETPPLNRIPVETMICGYDERIIRDTINRELQRQGQVYFLHNRVMSIERIAERVRLLCPGARVEIGHGQMDEDDLESVMRRFVAGDIDVLVSTTIIESGLDIPNANTIIIDRADRFGLADLYQLRGRVGRAQNKAYAYLLLPREMMTTGEARRRINAIKQYSSLGAGFKIAMRDLEIRGAGNILGTAQSGHVMAIGFELYCQLLKQAIAKIKGGRVRPRLETTVHLDFVATNEAEFLMTNEREKLAPAFLPVSYIQQPRTRIQAYKKLSETNSQQQLDQLRKAWRDRFGPLPAAVENLLLLTEMKLAAAARKINKLEVKERKLMLTRGDDYVLINGKFPRLSSESPVEQLRELTALIKDF